MLDKLKALTGKDMEDEFSDLSDEQIIYYNNNDPGNTSSRNLDTLNSSSPKHRKGSIDLGKDQNGGNQGSSSRGNSNLKNKTPSKLDTKKTPTGGKQPTN